MTTDRSDKIKDEVRNIYGNIAEKVAERNSGGVKWGCCGPLKTEQEACQCNSTQYYDPQEIRELPEGAAEASLGCGNPTAIAGLRSGEVVLDLGSGGGIDCFLAAGKVGPQGRVIGVDTTPQMLSLARRNAEEMGLTNVEFLKGDMENLPVGDGIVDVIISNCVVNLSPDKDAVFAEAYRVLKPGGRVAISDIVIVGELPQIIQDSLQAWAGCIAGALNEEDFTGKMRAAGLTDVQVTKRVFVPVDGFLGLPDIQEMINNMGPDMDIASLKKQVKGKIASVTVTAVKPL